MNCTLCAYEVKFILQYKEKGIQNKKLADLNDKLQGAENALKFAQFKASKTNKH
jgi:hypothetical protein